MFNPKTITASLLCSPLYWMGATAIALPNDFDTINGKLKPHQHITMDLATMGGSSFGTGSNYSDHSGVMRIVKRKKVKVCGYEITLPKPATCAAFGGVGLTAAFLGYTIAWNMKTSSDKKDCTLHTSSLDTFTWAWYATGTNCDTTAEQETIQGALQDYFANTGNKVCGVSCLELNHGGTWTGFVTLAAPGEDPNLYYCGSHNTFGNCVEGGKNDAGKRDITTIDLMEDVE